MLIFDSRNIALYAVIASSMHELGHLLTMIAFGRPPSKLELGIVGFRIESDPIGGGYTEDAVVSFSGAAVNVAAFFVLYYLTPYREFAAVNLCIGALNLLPVYPLDGARGLYSLLCRRYDALRAGSAVRVVSLVTLPPLAAASFYLLIRTGCNVSLLILIVYLLIGILRS